MEEERIREREVEEKECIILADTKHTTTLPGEKNAQVRKIPKIRNLELGNPNPNPSPRKATTSVAVTIEKESTNYYIIQIFLFNYYTFFFFVVIFLNVRINKLQWVCVHYLHKFVSLLLIIVDIIITPSFYVFQSWSRVSLSLSPSLLPHFDENMNCSIRQNL